MKLPRRRDYPDELWRLYLVMAGVGTVAVVIVGVAILISRLL